MAWRFNSGRAVKEIIIDFGKFWAKVDLTLARDYFVEMLLIGEVPDELKDKFVVVKNEDFEDTEESEYYTKGFNRKQIGTLGVVYLRPYFYFEWYSLGNGRCVIEIIYEESSFMSEGSSVHGTVRVYDKKLGLEQELLVRR